MIGQPDNSLQYDQILSLLQVELDCLNQIGVTQII